LERYVARLSATPAFFDAVSAIAADGARLGVTAPRVVVDRTIAQVERLLALQAGDSPGMQPVAAASPEVKDRVAATIGDVVYPAQQRYLEALRAYRPSATETLGISSLPDGE